MRDLDEDAGAVAGVVLAAARPAMIQVLEGREPVADELVGFAPLEVGDVYKRQPVLIVSLPHTSRFGRPRFGGRPFDPESFSNFDPTAACASEPGALARSSINDPRGSAVVRAEAPTDRVANPGMPSPEGRILRRGPAMENSPRRSRTDVSRSRRAGRGSRPTRSSRRP